MNYVSLLNVSMLLLIKTRKQVLKVHCQHQWNLQKKVLQKSTASKRMTTILKVLKEEALNRRNKSATNLINQLIFNYFN